MTEFPSFLSCSSINIHCDFFWDNLYFSRAYLNWNMEVVTIDNATKCHTIMITAMAITLIPLWLRIASLALDFQQKKYILCFCMKVFRMWATNTKKSINSDIYEPNEVGRYKMFGTSHIWDKIWNFCEIAFRSYHLPYM